MRPSRALFAEYSPTCVGIQVPITHNSMDPIQTTYDSANGAAITVRHLLSLHQQMSCTLELYFIR